MHKWGYRAFEAKGNLGLSMFWSLEQTDLRTAGMKGPFEALGHLAYMGFSTFGVLCTFTMPYYSINRDTLYFAVTSHAYLLCLSKVNLLPAKKKLDSKIDTAYIKWYQDTCRLCSYISII